MIINVARPPRIETSILDSLAPILRADCFIGSAELFAAWAKSGFMS